MKNMIFVRNNIKKIIIKYYNFKKKILKIKLNFEIFNTYLDSLDKIQFLLDIENFINIKLINIINTSLTFKEILNYIYINLNL